MNSIGNSGYDRVDRDHYPTPDENTAALVIGLKRAGIELPKRLRDPCAGEGKLARTLVRLAPGVLVAETDLYPYPNNPGLAPVPFDARDIAELDIALFLTGARAILTNPPCGRAVHSRIVNSCLSLLKAGAIDVLALMHMSAHVSTDGAHATMTKESTFALRVDCVWRTVLFAGGSTGKQSHSWRIWVREPRRKTGDSFPTISVSYAEADALLRGSAAA
jgi:hypothetical protein